MGYDKTYLTEAASISEIDSKIRQAARAGKVTLLTRNFGRGSDFIVRDQGLINVGGMHCIQTFGADSPSEDIQIRGRAARQGQDGSYSVIIKKNDLKEYKLSDIEIDSMFGDQDFHNLYLRYLEGMKIKVNEEQGDNEKNVEDLKAQHTLAHEAIN